MTETSLRQIIGAVLADHKRQTERQKRAFLRDDDTETAKPWDKNRAASEVVTDVFLSSDDARLEKQAQEMKLCSGVLHFVTDKKTQRLKLASVDLCRKRFCMICQWRRSLKLKARFLEVLPKITEAYPKAKWLLLTLTMKNCSLHELAKTISHMNESWTRLLRKKELAPVLGWTRAMEITKPDDVSTAHPHFHCLLLVTSTYFKGEKYVTQKRWTELWKESLRVDYDPIVHITAVKPRRDQTEQEAVGAAAAEALKYALKPADAAADDLWITTVAKISHGRRFFGTGGVLKGVLADQDDPLDVEAQAEDEAPKAEEPEPVQHVAYDWSATAKRYKRAPDKDRQSGQAKASAVVGAMRAETGEEFSREMRNLAKFSKRRGRPRKPL